MPTIYPQLSIILSLLGIIASIIMTIVYQKRKDLKILLLAYISATIGVVISTINDIVTQGVQGEIGHFISRIFLSSGAIIIFIHVFKEYLNIFKKNRIKFPVNSIMITSVPFLILTISFEILIIIFCLISAFMVFRIYLKKKTLSHAFLGMALSTVFLALLFTIIESLEVEYLRLYALGMDIIFFNMLLVSAIVALLDLRLMNTELEKNDMKDKYSHNLGNIFHTISMAYDLIKMEENLQDIPNDMDDLIKRKLKEASDLVRFIRDL